MLLSALPTLADLKEAQEVMKANDITSPVVSSEEFNSAMGNHILFKLENTQEGGSFKIRGVTYALSKLSEEERARGVITHSSGNHGLALAQACQKLNISCQVLVPSDVSKLKAHYIESAGADLIYIDGPSRDGACRARAVTSGRVFIPPYDDLDVITGQSTVASEFLEQQPDLDLMIMPVSGGGLLSGALLAKEHFGAKALRVIGARPSWASTAGAIFNEKEDYKPVETAADALRSSPGLIPTKIMTRFEPEIRGVSDAWMSESQEIMNRYLNQKAEISSAAALAVLRVNALEFKDLNIGVVVTGGNV